MINLPVISCDNCGVCCEWMGYPPFSEEEIIPDIPIEHKKHGTHCSWFNTSTRKCNHYEDRPKICRDFEVGCYDCIFLRDRYRREKCHQILITQ